MQGTLTKDNAVSEAFKIQGEVSVLAVGEGMLVLMRSLNGGDYYPVTDHRGDPLEFYGTDPEDVVINSEFSNICPAASFKLAADTVSGITYTLSGGVK